MAERHISLDRVFSDSWKSMVRILFKPLSLERWLVLGFCCWMLMIGGELGTLLQIAPGRLLPISTLHRLARKLHSLKLWETLDHILNGSDGGFLHRVATGLRIEPAALSHGLWTVAAVTLLFLAFSILCYWLTCRFCFVFLDNLVQEKNEIRRPWREFRELGNSYFLGSLGFSVAILAINLAFLGVGVAIVCSWLSECAAARQFAAFGDERVFLTVLLAAAWVVVSLALGVYFWFFYYLLLPIMYRDRVGFGEGLRRMNLILLKHFGTSFLFWLMMLVIQFGFGLAVAAAMLLTCGLMVFVIGLPYVRGIVFLPVWAFLQLSGVRLLEELDPKEAAESASAERLPD